MIKNQTDYERLFVEYEILLHSLDPVPDKILLDIENKIQEYESTMNITPTGIEHACLMSLLLEKSHLTQSGLADALDVSQPLINRILKGNVKISKKLARKLAAYFRLDLKLFGSL
ncbi:MAG: helix-turn-helix transcriptional regulator [Saprospiraceae bacterium]|nr:helix-turn-helix transcriptional regulator [Saprospiraceae bacterium]